MVFNMNKRIEGGCFCSSVRYSFESDDYLSSNCHCSMCRRTSGAPFVSWMAIPLSHFQYTQGQPKKLNSSSHGARYFCPECGTQMYGVLAEDGPKTISIRPGTTNQRAQLPPKRQIWGHSAMPWIHNLKGVAMSLEQD